jgi:IBR domain, a half RING-finger domain
MPDISFDEAMSKFPFVMALIGLIVSGFKITIASRSEQWDELYVTNIKKMNEFKQKKAVDPRIPNESCLLSMLFISIGRCLPWYMKKETLNEKVLSQIDSCMSKANAKISEGDTSFEPLLAPLGLPKVAIMPRRLKPMEVRLLGGRKMPDRVEVSLSFFPHEANESAGILKSQEAQFVADLMGSSTDKPSVTLQCALKTKTKDCNVLLHKSRRNACVMSAEDLANGLLAFLPRAKLIEVHTERGKENIFSIPCPCCETLKAATLPLSLLPSSASASAAAAGGGGSGHGEAEESHRTNLVRGYVHSINISAKELNELLKVHGRKDCMEAIKLGFGQAAENTPGFHTFTCPNEACKMHTNTVPFRVAKSCSGCISSFKELHTGYLHRYECHKCHTVGCALCGKDAASHVNGLCGAATEEMAARVLGQKPCPGCKAWTEKEGGCRHMTCKCGTHWCWDHEEAWDKGWQGMGHDRLHGSYSCPGYEAKVAAGEARREGESVSGPGHTINT